MFGLVAVNIDDFFEFRSTTNNRGHAYELFKPRCRLLAVFEVVFFAERVVNVWNSLPSSVCFSTLPSFRRTIHDVDLSGFMKCS